MYIVACMSYVLWTDVYDIIDINLFVSTVLNKIVCNVSAARMAACSWRAVTLCSTLMLVMMCSLSVCEHPPPTQPPQPHQRTCHITHHWAHSMEP